MIEENYEKKPSQISRHRHLNQGPGTSRMRVSCVTTEPPRSVSAIIVTDDYLCYKEPKGLTTFFLF